MIFTEPPSESLRTVLVESSDSLQNASPQEEFPEYPPGFGCRVFNISADEPPRDGEPDQEKAARIERNVERARRRNDRPDPPPEQGLRRDLSDAFDMCGG